MATLQRQVRPFLMNHIALPDSALAVTTPYKIQHRSNHIKHSNTFLPEPWGLFKTISLSAASADAFTDSLCIRLCRNSTPSSWRLLQTLRGFATTAAPWNAKLREDPTAQLAEAEEAGAHCTAATVPAQPTAAIAPPKLPAHLCCSCSTLYLSTSSALLSTQRQQKLQRSKVR